jgi:hypothetical protein
MIVTTSICANYIPKARVLARSVKKQHPDAKFVLCLVEKEIDPRIREDKLFDLILTPEMLSIPQYKSFLFRYTIVEASTAVKGHLMLKLLERFPDQEIFLYMDPDTISASPMTELLDFLKKWEIVLTPHLTEPESSLVAILDNELSALKHGAYNLGFLGIRRGAESLRFLRWWSDRLYALCYADYARGLFTDQKWVDLAPGFFEIGIFKHPGYNLAPWNLSRRKTTWDSTKSNLLVNGLPLRFFHFSGFDSGANEAMITKYCPDAENPVFTLRKKYIEDCEAAGQSEFGKTPWSYGFYDDGTKIRLEERKAVREFPESHPDPYKKKPKPLKKPGVVSHARRYLGKVKRKVEGSFWKRPVT